MIGGQDKQVIIGQRSSQARDVRVDLRERAGEALEIVAMAVDLIGLDQVREHEPVVQPADQRQSSPASARALVAPGCWTSIPTPANSCPTLPTECTSMPAA